MKIVIRSVLQGDNKYYSQIVLGECFYELQKSCIAIKLMFQKELISINQINQKNPSFVIIDIFYI